MIQKIACNFIENLYLFFWRWLRMDTLLVSRRTCPHAWPEAGVCCQSHWWKWRVCWKSLTSRNRRKSFGISCALVWPPMAWRVRCSRWWGNMSDRRAVPWAVLSGPKSDKATQQQWPPSPTYCSRQSNLRYRMQLYLCTEQTAWDFAEITVLDSNYSF